MGHQEPSYHHASVGPDPLEFNLGDRSYQLWPVIKPLYILKGNQVFEMVGPTFTMDNLGPIIRSTATLSVNNWHNKGRKLVSSSPASVINKYPNHIHLNLDEASWWFCWWTRREQWCTNKPCSTVQVPEGYISFVATLIEVWLLWRMPRIKMEVYTLLYNHLQTNQWCHRETDPHTYR